MLPKIKDLGKLKEKYLVSSASSRCLVIDICSIFKAINVHLVSFPPEMRFMDFNTPYRLMLSDTFSLQLVFFSRSLQPSVI